MANDGLTGCPFDQAFPTPSIEGDNAGVRNGYDLGEGSQKATPWAISPIETFKFGPGDPGVDGKVGNDFEVSPTQRTIKP